MVTKAVTRVKKLKIATSVGKPLVIVNPLLCIRESTQERNLMSIRNATRPSARLPI